MNSQFEPNTARTTISAVTQINHRLLAKLRCPACREGTFRETYRDVLICQAYNSSFPIISGIPDLTYFPKSNDEAIAFNNAQAQYESQIHNYVAQNDYEQIVIQRFGDKTESIATGWAKVFPGPILDFGCGTGQVCRYLRKYHAEVYGFDISPISVQKNVNDNGVLAVVANAFYVPFADRAFETVCCNGVLHHTVDLKTVISEMARVCNKHIVISEGCVSSYHPIWVKFRQYSFCSIKLLLKFCGLLDIIKRKRGISRGTGTASKYERPLDPKDIVEFLKEASFKISRLRFWTNLNWRRRSRLKKLLIRMMVSRRAGTHFEIHAERNDNQLCSTTV